MTVLPCFLRAELCSIVGMDHIFFVHLSIGRHSECFQPFFSPSFFFLFGYTVWHAGPQFSNQGSDPHTVQWKPGFLTSGLPGTSLPGLLFKNSVYDFLMGNLCENHWNDLWPLPWGKGVGQHGGGELELRACQKTLLLLDKWLLSGHSVVSCPAVPSPALAVSCK